MSPEYAAAIKAHDAAQAVYWPILEAFRAGKVGYDEYFAARAVYTAATEAFDAVYFAEQGREDETVAETAAPVQFGFQF